MFASITLMILIKIHTQVKEVQLKLTFITGKNISDICIDSYGDLFIENVYIYWELERHIMTINHFFLSQRVQVFGLSFV